ncbi:MAG: alpha/beta fold hydrolase [Planctomycetes bacterium]|nr:alpha/beta fold hydrolase [Planctomycetota bacterium]
MVAASLLLPASDGPSGGPLRLRAALSATGALVVPALPSGAADLRTLVAAIEAALDAAEVAAAHVVGLSFGGQLAQALCELAPSRVASLLLVASGAPDRARAVALARSRWLWRWFPDASRRPRERLLASDRDGAHLPGAFAGCKAPVALIELGADGVIAPRESARLRALFPESGVTVVEGLTHAALHEWPEPLARAFDAARVRLFSGSARAGSR